MLNQTKYEKTLQVQDQLALEYIIGDMFLVVGKTRLLRRIRKYFKNCKRRGGRLTYDEAWVTVSAIYYQFDYIEKMNEDYLEYMDKLMDVLDEYVVTNNLPVGESLLKVVGPELYYNEVM